jgi:hypothetical protein
LVNDRFECFGVELGQLGRDTHLQLLFAKPPNHRVRAPDHGCQRQDRRPVNPMLITESPGAPGGGQLEDIEKLAE